MPSSPQKREMPYGSFQYFPSTSARLNIQRLSVPGEVWDEGLKDYSRMRDIWNAGVGEMVSL